MAEEAWKLAIEAQDGERPVAGAPVGTPLVCQLPSGWSLKIDPQTREAVSVEFCSMLFYQIYDIDYAPKYTSLKLIISTIWGLLENGAHRTVVHSSQVDLWSETKLRIQVKEVMFDDQYLSKVVDNEKSWFTQVEMHDLICHQFFFTANSWGCQPPTSQYFQPLTPQTLALVAAAIQCALSEYASGKIVTVMISQDEHRVTYCPSPMIIITPEATALINHLLVGLFKPPHPLPPSCGATPLG